MNKIFAKLASLAMIGLPLGTAIACDSSKSELNPAGTLVIARWGNEVEAKSQKVAIDAFEKKHNTKVKIVTLDYGRRIEQISKWAASGSLPDIIETDGVDFSNYAEQEIIKMIDPSKIEASTLSGLVPQSLTVMIGQIKSGKWSYGVIPKTISSSTLTDKSSLWGIPKEFNTLGVYINKEAFSWTNEITSRTAGTYAKWKAKWEATPSKTNNKLFTMLKGLYTGTGLTKKTGYLKGPLSFTNDPNRFTQLFSDADYEAFKSYSKDEIENNKAKLKTAIKGWWNSIGEQYKNVNKEGGTLTSQKHGYAWNGEAFNKKAVGAVIEGAWFTPSDKVFNANQWDIWSAPTPGLFPQGWALTKTSNDDDLAYKFLSYMASEKGSGEETSLTGALPVNKIAFVNQYKKAVDTSDETFSNQLKTKIKSHSQGFITGSGQNVMFNDQAKARPLLFTTEYPTFSKAWFDEMNPLVTNSGSGLTKAAYDTAIDSIVDEWVTELSAI